MFFLCWQTSSVMRYCIVYGPLHLFCTSVVDASLLCYDFPHHVVRCLIYHIVSLCPSVCLSDESIHIYMYIYIYIYIYNIVLLYIILAHICLLGICLLLGQIKVDDEDDVCVYVVVCLHVFIMTCLCVCTLRACGVD